MDVGEASASKSQVKRRSHPKVKSGCLTCKIRRVKCDEQKPSCRRCIKFGINCDGYPPTKGTKGPRQPRRKPTLLPKFHYIILSRPPSLSRFASDEELRYFEVFSSNTAYEILPNVEMGKLRIMFLQASESKDFIRHAIVALGALDMTSQASSPQGHTRCPARDNQSRIAIYHYQYAVKEYAQAIKCAQIYGDEKDFRMALITSLVILSFEGWVGNHEVAIQQIRIGTRLLKEWKERYRDRMVLGYSTSASIEEENTLSHIFTRLSIQLRAPPTDRSSQSSMSSPLPPLRIDSPESRERMPESFSTLAEAGKFYSAIVRFAVSFVAQGLPRIAKASSLTGAYTVASVGEKIPPEIAKAQTTLTNSLYRWMAAFAPIANSREFKPIDERKASLTLELQMKATFMGTIKSLAQDELVFDTYYAIYSDIVNISEALLNCSKSSRVPKFSFDSGVIIPLWFTGHKCRDTILRRRVISLLLEFPRREGVWDSVFAGLVIECLRGFEEEYMDNGWVPGWARIRTTNINVDLEKRIVEIECQQRMSATSEEFVTRYKTLDYYVYTGVTLEQVGAVIAR